jgi:hypothetical protein
MWIDYDWVCIGVAARMQKEVTAMWHGAKYVDFWS